ncbi:MAG: OmpA family protein [Prevotellaceae bacterium]|nr:OmpA family protein [Prevotellaceae bacterium]
MKLKNILMVGLAAMTFATANAQDDKEKTEYVFNPHWYGQLQVGGQYTIGELSFGDLLSPNVQIGVGYNFNKVVGARLSVNAWQSKAGIENLSVYSNGQVASTKSYDWKWSYVQPAIDATFNLTNLFCEYNPKRLITVGVFGGIGLNIAFDNDDAVAVNNELVANNQSLEYIWDDTKVRFTARVGANVDFRLSDAVSLGVEVQANTLNDHYNSKKASNPDWYINALVGIKYNFGKTYTTRKVKPVAPVERVIERIVEKPVPQPQRPEPVREPAKAVEETMRREVFFTINSNKISDSEQKKIDEVADFMLKNMSKKVTVTGYADKGTGNNTVNDRISAKRADIVVNALVNKGIARDRITKESKGSRVQPFNENDKNRVAICVAE